MSTSAYRAANSSRSRQAASELDGYAFAWRRRAPGTTVTVAGGSTWRSPVHRASGSPQRAIASHQRRCAWTYMSPISRPAKVAVSARWKWRMSPPE